MAMDETIDFIIKQKALAVIGVSDKKFGGNIYRELKKRGIRVYAVNPKRDRFDGDPCYNSVKDIPEKIKAAIVALAPDTANAIVAEFREAGITHLWFERGKDFYQAEVNAQAQGINTVSGKCILMYAGEVKGIHAIHRFFSKLTGNY